MDFLCDWQGVLIFIFCVYVKLQSTGVGRMKVNSNCFLFVQMNSNNGSKVDYIYLFFQVKDQPNVSGGSANSVGGLANRQHGLPGLHARNVTLRLVICTT